MEEEEEEEEVPAAVNQSLEVDLAKVGDDDEDLRTEALLVERRFRPVYQDHRQWLARDARVLSMWKEVTEGQSFGVKV
jgi:hypothetical protein